MKAKKDNKVYRISETQKERYLNDGFDVFDDEGDILEYSPLKKIEYSKYVELLKENAILKAKIDALEVMNDSGKEKPLSKMNKTELITKATELGLEVTQDMTCESIANLIKENHG